MRPYTTCAMLSYNMCNIIIHVQLSNFMCNVFFTTCVTVYIIYGMYNICRKLVYEQVCMDFELVYF